MSDWDDLETGLAEQVVSEFGDVVTITLPDGSTIDAGVILDRTTRLRGTLGDVIDPRPSGQFLVADVGNKPTGSFDLNGQTWNFGRPIDGENDGYLVKVWLEPAS